VAPSLLVVEPKLPLFSDDPDFRAGVSSSSLRNCELFMLLSNRRCGNESGLQDVALDEVRNIQFRLCNGREAEEYDERG
jgi:hypothetical protein